MRPNRSLLGYMDEPASQRRRRPFPEATGNAAFRTTTKRPRVWQAGDRPQRHATGPRRARRRQARAREPRASPQTAPASSDRSATREARLDRVRRTATGEDERRLPARGAPGSARWLLAPAPDSPAAGRTARGQYGSRGDRVARGVEPHPRGRSRAERVSVRAGALEQQHLHARDELPACAGARDVLDSRGSPIARL